MIKGKIVYVTGPTASGKTELGVRIAEKYGGEIVSADSMQIYKGIHIASAAPDDNEKRGIPHHLIEFLPLSRQFSVADYVAAARQCIDEILSRKKLPVVVGGTGLYISALTDNIEFADEQTDLKLRGELDDEFERVGGEEMLSHLAAFDPETAARLHPNNRRRIIRAFEVYRLTGKTVTEQNKLSRQSQPRYDNLILGVTSRDREWLYNRINLRVDKMLENGLAEEAKKTISLPLNSGGMQAIGHKELYGYLKGECTIEEAAQRLKQSTRRYAKRQLTWFRRDTRIKWLYADEEPIFERAQSLIDEFLGEDERNEE